MTEQSLLKFSIAITVLLAAFGIGAGLFSGSFAVVFDGIYALTDAFMTVLALLVALVLGGFIAVLGTLWRRHWASGAIDGLNGLLLAIPEFVWALALVLVLVLLVSMALLAGVKRQGRTA